MAYKIELKSVVAKNGNGQKPSNRWRSNLFNLARYASFGYSMARLSQHKVPITPPLHRVRTNCQPTARALPTDYGPSWFVRRYGIKAAQHYGAIRAALEKQGQVNDLHIAGHARSEGLGTGYEHYVRVQARASTGGGELDLKGKNIV